VPADVEVLDPGPLTSIQDASGRRDFRHLGVPTAGAADAFSAALANRLAGNEPDAALLEVTLPGAMFAFTAPTLIGLAGADLGAVIDGVPLTAPAARRVPADASLRFTGRRVGTRAYLAFAGGIDVEPVLGSRSTDLRSRFGGLEGRALRAGDRLALARSDRAAPGWLTSTLRRVATAQVVQDVPLQILPGPHLDRCGPDAFERLCGSLWRVSREADRAGIRLDGPPLDHLGEPEVPSVALPLGAVQVPPDGRPIVMLADRPVTGGYPVVGCLARAAVGRAAQLLVGDEVRFAPVAAAKAREELRMLETLLREGVRSEDDPGPAWAGALD
jgi:biotin-dependent carboxylase-like uncharacterized protein